jgi:hypothetical protein
MNPSDLYEALKNENKNLVATMADLKQQNAKLIAAVEKLQAEASNVGVTLNDGTRRMYKANDYVLLPSKNAPVTVEFRMVDKTEHTYQEVAHIRFSEVKEVHGPSA